jgi:hypothetical protein
MITHQLSATTPDNTNYEIRPTHWNQEHAQVITLTGNTAGASTISGTNIVFSGGPNATLSVNGNTLVWSGGAGAAAQTGISGIIVSDATYTSGTVSFSNQNGVTIGSSVNGASQYIRLSVNTSYLASNVSSNYVHVSGSATTISGVTTANVVGTNSTRWAMEDHQHAGVYGAGVSTGGNTAGNTAAERPGRWIFAGSNAITLSQETAANSAQTIHIQGPISATTISGVTSANVIGTRGSRFALEDHQHVGVYSAGVSTGGNTAGDTAVRPGQIVFAGGANITLSMATGAGSLQTVSIVGGAGGGGSQSVGMSTQTAGGATAGTTGYASGSAILYHLVPGSNITMSQSVNGASGTMSIYAPSPGAAAENNWVNLLGANTAGNTTASGSTLGFSGINLTLSGTNGSAINFSAPATSSLVGSSGVSISTNGSTITVGLRLGSYFENMNGEWGNSTTLQALQSTSHVQQFVLEWPVSFGQLRMPMSASCAASSTHATTGNSSWSYGHSRSHNFVIYSRGVGASSMSLQSIMSTQLTDQQSIRVSANANSTQFSYSNRATYQMSTGAVGFTFDYSSSAASCNYHTSNMTAITGLKQMEFSWANSLTPGQYWLAYGVSSSTVSQHNAQGTRLFNIMSVYGVSQPNLAFGTIGAATNNSVGLVAGAGSFTTAGGGTTASLPISAVTTSAAHNKPVFQLFHIA